MKKYNHAPCKRQGKFASSLTKEKGAQSPISPIRARIRKHHKFDLYRFQSLPFPSEDMLN